jgi:uncharacterized membrane protein (UPF0182 family)
MKKVLANLFILLSLISPLVLMGTVSASTYSIVPQCASGGSLSSSDTSFCPDVKGATAGASNDPVLKILTDVMTVLSFIAGIAAVILIIISGIKFSASGGDAAKVSSAKGSLINALIGVLIVVFSQTIIAFVLDKIS